MTELYPELTDLVSKKVLLLNNYHGLCKNFDQNYKIVIYSSFGEACNPKELTQVIDHYKNSFVIIITTRKYHEFTHLDNRHKIISIPCAYSWYAKNISHCDSVDIVNRTFEKKFLSLNNRAQWNRQGLLQFLLTDKLLDQFFFSYHCADRFNVSKKKLYDITNNIIGQTWFNHKLDLEQVYKLLPVTTGLDNVTDQSNDWGVGNPIYYNNSFASIVNETYIDENYDPFFTEKIMKPIAYGHPFYVFSSAGALDTLKNLGFKTFEDVFDESYDQIDSPQLRFEHILLEIRRICQMSDRELTLLHKKLIPRLEANRDFFYKNFANEYQKRIVDVKKEIENIIKNY